MAPSVFKSISIPTANREFSVAAHALLGDERSIGPLRAVNAIVGPNNSGKSRLLRSLYWNDGLTGERVAPATDKARGLLNRVAPDVQSVLANRRIRDSTEDQPRRSQIVEAWDRLLRGDVALTNRAFSTSKDGKLHLVHMLQDLMGIIAKVSGGAAGPQIRIAQEFKTAKQVALEPPKATKHVYIPVLRSMRPQAGVGVEVMGQVYTREYFSRQNYGHCELFTGQKAYPLIESLKNGEAPQRRAIREFEQFLSRQCFGGTSVDITALKGEGKGAEGTVLIGIGREREQPLHYLGDGLQHLIMLTLPMFLWPGHNILLFVEEPELCLHPGFQRRLIDAWLETPSDSARQVFAATHSHHFMDHTLDTSEIQVFRVTKHLASSTSDQALPSFHIDAAVGAERSILEELGVRNSSVFLSNCTIWVEGITDRKYIRHWLTLLNLHNDRPLRGCLEDLHYSFVEYGGSCITHWSFLDEERGIDVERLCGTLFLIADHDNTQTGAKADRHRVLKERLKERFYLLPVREIENLISPDVLRRTLERLRPSIEKNRATFKPKDFESTGLGQYLDRQIEEQSLYPADSKRGAKFAAESGTIRDKSAFADAAIAETGSWSDLSPEAQKLTRAIADFIERHCTWRSDGQG